MARASSLPLEAVRGTAGWRRAGVIPTAGAGRRSRRWQRGALAQAKEGLEMVQAGGGDGRWTGHSGWRKGLGEADIPILTKQLPIAKPTPLSFLGLEKRVSQGPGIGGKGPQGATSLHTGGVEAGGSRSAGAGRRGGGGEPGTAELSPEQDANRQSWEKSLGARELSMLPPRAAPACTQPREGATGRRRWPPEGVWDPAGCT